MVSDPRDTYVFGQHSPPPKKIKYSETKGSEKYCFKTILTSHLINAYLFLIQNIFQCSEMVLAGGIALFALGGIYKKFLDDKETGSMTNKPYKEYYTVYRYAWGLKYYS